MELAFSEKIQLTGSVVPTRCLGLLVYEDRRMVLSAYFFLFLNRNCVVHSLSLSVFSVSLRSFSFVCLCCLSLTSTVDKSIVCAVVFEAMFRIE